LSNPWLVHADGNLKKMRIYDLLLKRKQTRMRTVWRGDSKGKVAYDDITL